MSRIRYFCRGGMYPDDAQRIKQLLEQQRMEEARELDRQARERWCMDKLNSPRCGYDLTDIYANLEPGEHVINCPRCGTEQRVRKG